MADYESPFASEFTVTDSEVDADDEADDSESVAEMLRQFPRAPRTRLCYCQGPETEKMISCDASCPIEWYHFECVGIKDEEEARGIFKYSCPRCTKTKGIHTIWRDELGNGGPRKLFVEERAKVYAVLQDYEARREAFLNKQAAERMVVHERVMAAKWAREEGATYEYASPSTPRAGYPRSCDDVSLSMTKMPPRPMRSTARSRQVRQQKERRAEIAKRIAASELGKDQAENMVNGEASDDGEAEAG